MPADVQKELVDVDLSRPELHARGAAVGIEQEPQAVASLERRRRRA